MKAVTFLSSNLSYIKRELLSCLLYLNLIIIHPNTPLIGPGLEYVFKISHRKTEIVEGQGEKYLFMVKSKSVQTIENAPCLHCTWF